MSREKISAHAAIKEATEIHARLGFLLGSIEERLIPVPPLWRGAVPGEIWVLTIAGEDRPAEIVPSASINPMFAVLDRGTRDRIFADSHLISDGHRIFPEAVSS